MVYYGNQRQLEYDLVLAPGTNPRNIRLKIRGAENLRIDASGDLLLRVAGAEIRQRKPVLYQKAGSRVRRIEGAYVLLARKKVGFHVGPYNLHQSLVIDPVLVFSSYLGGSGEDAAYRVALDRDRNVYITGSPARRISSLKMA